MVWCGATHLDIVQIIAHVCSAALSVLPNGVLGRGREGGREGGKDQGRGEREERERRERRERGGGREKEREREAAGEAAHFITMIPLSVAASRSMLSTPVPARPMSHSSLPAAMTSAVTLVEERTMRPV